MSASFRRIPKAGKFIFLLLMLVTAVASAFLDNVTTMLLMIPVTIEIAVTLKINPIALLIPEVFASNVGGYSTPDNNLVEINFFSSYSEKKESY